MTAITPDEGIKVARHYNGVFEEAPYGIVIVDPNGIIIAANRESERMFRWSRDEMRGHPVEMLVAADAVESHRQRREQSPYNGRAMHDRTGLRGRRKDGSEFPASIALTPIDAEVGRGMAAFIVDNSEKFRAEDRYRTLMAHANDAIFVLDARGDIVETNRQAEKLVGHSAADLLGNHFASHVDASGRDRTERELGQLLESGTLSVRRIPIRRSDGAIVLVDFSASVVKDDKSSFILAIGRDVTAEVRREEHAAARHAVAATFADAASVSDATPRMLEAIGRALSCDIATLWLVDPDPGVLVCSHVWHGESEVLAAFADASRAQTFAAGEGLPGRVWASEREEFISDLQGAAHYARHALARGAGLRSACGFAVRGGERTIGVIELLCRSERSADPELGESLRGIGLQVGQFIERTRSEQERADLERQLVQAQKMEAIGQLAGGVAHDFNNILAVILMNSAFLLEALSIEDARRADGIEIQRAAERAQTLTRQLLAFSRRQVLEPRALTLDVVLSDVEKMLRRILGEDIELVSPRAPDLWTVRVDPGQMEQVILNLVVNARDAMPRGGKLTIETANVEIQTPQASAHGVIAPGCYVALKVSDTGSGMDAETLRRAFEPFFTTKEKGRGTGLGLATVYGIVKQSGGHVSVHSETGVGTTFMIHLPRVDDRADHSTATAAPATVAGGSETILLVEDEPAVRTAAARAIRARGYRVIVATSGTDAIDLADRHAGSIDLIVTDVVMPGLDGRETVERIRQFREGVAVLYASGFPDHAIVRDGELERGTNFIHKPFTPDALAARIRQVLDARGGEAAGAA